MRSLFIVLLSFGLSGCAPRLVENPMASAPTYDFQEQEEEYGKLLKAEEPAKWGLRLRARVHLETGNRTYRLLLPEGMSLSSLPREDKEKIRLVFLKEIEAIEIFFTKYRGKYRVRYPNGDLKVQRMSNAVENTVNALLILWRQALEEVEQAP